MKEPLEYPMKLMLRDVGSMEFTCLEDLSKVIPEKSEGKPLNYGQGEGQVEIDGTIWGFYVNEKGVYYMAFEEGRLEWSTFYILVESIICSIDRSFGVSARIEVKGPFTNRLDI